MENKRYYYLKLKEDFFDNEDIKILESMDNGYLYSNILLKMYLLSLKNEGKLIFREFIPYDTKMIATITGHNVDIVDKSLCIFKQLGIIEVLDNGAIFMSDIQKLIGSATTESERKAEYRARIKEEQNSLIDAEQPINEIDKAINNIIDYLNKATNTHFKHKTVKTRSLIRARLEDYTEDDIKMVIDKKVKEWTGTKYEKHLVPETLFNASHFESYYNQKETPTYKQKQNYHSPNNNIVDEYNEWESIAQELEREQGDFKV